MKPCVSRDVPQNIVEAPDKWHGAKRAVYNHVRPYIHGGPPQGK